MTAHADMTRIPAELLTTGQMALADRLTIEAGTPGIVLMEAAGKAVADTVSALAPQAEKVMVLCGPGNNGGDGFVAARLLRQRGYAVRLALLGRHGALTGDAAEMAGLWDRDIDPLFPGFIAGADVIVDAIFGAGLTRDIEGVAAETIAAANAADAPVVAVDVPSGIDGNTGKVCGTAIEATSTVTFFRAKPGHYLFPGRAHCGALRVADIGIEPGVLKTAGQNIFLDVPALWREIFPWPSPEGHKYSRGHAVVVSGGPDMTGAARLSARGALRAGAGLVTLAGSKAATSVNAAHSTAVMLHSFSGVKGLEALLADQRKNAALIGPGAGVSKQTGALVRAMLKSGAACVFDADALTSFEKDPGALCAAISGRGNPVVMTPHEGEFARLFAGNSPVAPKLERVCDAAARSGAVVVLKGADTVVAGPDGRAAINANAPPWLATAGSGDVLAGFILGLLAQGMPSFEAASAAVWLHGACAAKFGPGLIAEDLSEVLPAILGELYALRAPSA